MNKVKINILYGIREDAWGGANQFLKAIKKELIKKGVYESNLSKANCILFNSHHNLKKALELKLKNQNLVFIHRVDGPVHLYRSSKDNIDKKLYYVNNLIADGTIFQSEWSRQKNYYLGLRKNKLDTVIMNASDRNIFFPFDGEKKMGDKCELLAVSWSKNYNKGFNLYKFLDENLSFEKYNMTFVGNTPIQFKNIKHIKPLDPPKLAELYRDKDIYITGSKNDPCSNSLIEALSSNLPCVVLNDGGHPEIVRNGGETFNKFEECIEKIDIIRKNYENYKNSIQVPDLEDTVIKYIKFCELVYSKCSTKDISTKKLTRLQYYISLFREKLNSISSIERIKLQFSRMIHHIKNKLINN